MLLVVQLTFKRRRSGCSLCVCGLALGQSDPPSAGHHEVYSHVLVLQHDTTEMRAISGNALILQPRELGGVRELTCRPALVACRLTLKLYALMAGVGRKYFGQASSRTAQNIRGTCHPLNVVSAHPPVGSVKYARRQESKAVVGHHRLASTILKISPLTGFVGRRPL